MAYAVNDVRVGAHEWVERFGAGPFFVRTHIPLDDVIYRGKPATFDHSSAYGQWGEVMVELVHDHGMGPSVVRERYPPGEEGLHHVAFFVDDLDEATKQLQDLGFAVAMTARALATRFHFVDAVQELGHMIELYQRSTRLNAFYDMIRSASLGWDGSNPIRDV